jgi:predicted ribosome quality control (RQC) complex YloA/Tae2 family protein
MARSRDLWLHVQGYHGSHVIVRAENREVPFETVLFAAKLAAGHSQARQSDNVPVDYTLKKNVWKVKGAPAGAVNFTQQKTVYVTPNRNPQEAAEVD